MSRVGWSWAKRLCLNLKAEMQGGPGRSLFRSTIALSQGNAILYKRCMEDSHSWLSVSAMRRVG